MAVGGSTRSKRRLGRYMKPFMEAAELKPDRGDSTVKGPSRQTIARLMDGEHLPRWKNFTAVLEQLDVTHEQYRRAIELYVIADTESSPTIAHAQDLPANYQRFRMDEAEATHERTLDPMYVPGLLQTADYAEALARSFHRMIAGLPWNDVVAAERGDRQNLLTKEPAPLALHALIDEAVLRRNIGGPNVMSGQLDQLSTVSTQNNITIQVIPSSAGGYGVNSPVTLLRFPDDPELPEPDAAFIEVITPSLQSSIQAAAEGNPTDVLSAVWHDAAAIALSPEDSTRFIEELRDKLKGNHD